MLKWTKLVVLLSLASLFILTACNAGGAAPAAQATPVPATKASGKIVSEAVVVPARSAKLSFPIAGAVAEAPVKVGDRVAAGQVMARLETTDLENNVKKAENGVKKAETGVKRAEAGVKTAQAQLAKTKAPAREVDIAAAEAKVTVAEAGVVSAQARLAASQARAGDAQAGVTSAQGRLAAAQAGLEKTTSGPTDEAVAIAERKIEQAKNALWGAQAQRDAACGRAGDKDSPRSARDMAQTECDAARASVNSAEEGIRVAELQLQELKQGPRDADVKSAQAGITQGQGDVAGARARAQAASSDIAATQTEISNAQANVTAARADLERAKAPATAEDIAIAEAGVNTAQTELAGAQTDLAAAQSDLAIARSELDKATLKAPFGGTVVVLDAKVGERVQPGVVIAQIADLSQWEIETTDLTELNVVRLKVGDPVILTFDAIPGLELPGTITRIGDLGENKQGDIVYTVVIKPDRQDERLRWRMTTSATFEPK